MAKDPAFLWYSKDWLQGTASMSLEEKGAYADLLSHQHQDGFIPNNPVRLAKMLGISVEDFTRIWEFLKTKFVEIEPGKLVNKKLDKVVTERTDFAKMRTIIGTFGSLLKRMDIPEEQKTHLRTKFNYIDFLSKDKQTVKQDISKWIAVCLSPFKQTHGDAIGNEDEDGNIIKGNGGTGEKEKLQYLITFRSDCLTRQIWAENFCMTTGVNLDDLPKLLTEFNAHVISMGKVITNLADYQNYATKWKLNKNTINTGGPGNEPKKLLL